MPQRAGMSLEHVRNAPPICVACYHRLQSALSYGLGIQIGEEMR